jgi:hypothetical protein
MSLKQRLEFEMLKLHNEVLRQQLSEVRQLLRDRRPA